MSFGSEAMTSVLLADSRLFIRGGLRTLLQVRGNFRVCGEATDGRQAVDLAVQKRPDIVIMNIDLPGIDGIEATRRISRSTPATQILIFTAEDNEDLMREAMRAGACGYLLKSAPDEQIIEAIETLGAKQAYRPGFRYEKRFDDATAQAGIKHASPRLTRREREILRLVAQGHRNKVIATMLGISVKTVDTHRATAMRKLDLRSTADVVHYAIREKLVQTLRDPPNR
jgi:DNA-binding NarL/FixJ family response regulator